MTTDFDLDRKVQAAVRRFEAPGVAVAVVEGAAVSFQKGYGVRRLGAPEKVDVHTAFAIGSCTKAFTAAALAILVDEKKLGWEDRVVDRLPGFQMYDPYATREMTVRDLLLHRSGLGLGAGDLLFWTGSTVKRSEILSRLRHIKPAYSFRSRFAYDNILYGVAGELVTAVTGLGWGEFVSRRLLMPLGMDDAATSFEAVRTPNRALPHGRIGGALRGLGAVEPLPPVSGLGDEGAGGSLNASVADMGRWLSMLLSGGRLPGGAQLLSPEAMREMWLPQMQIRSRGPMGLLVYDTPNFQSYGLGWFVSDYKGRKVVTHAGGTIGGVSLVTILPDQGVGFVILTNFEEVEFLRALNLTLLDHFIGAPAVDWIEKAYVFDQAEKAEAVRRAAEVAQANPARGSGPSLPLSRYAGRYRDPWYGTMTITQGAAGLRMSLDGSPRLKGALEHVGGDIFRTRYDERGLEDAYLTFALTPDGGIDQVKLKAVSPMADFSYNYKDLQFTPEVIR